MPIINTTSRRQPQRAIPLKPEFARYLVSCFYGSIWSPSGHHWAWPQITTSLNGKSGEVITSASVAQLVDDSTYVIPSGSDATIVIVIDKNDSSVAANFSIQASSSDTADFNAFLPFSGDGKAYFRWGANAVEGSTSVSGTAIGSTGVFVLSTGSDGMQIWQNGVLIASNSGNPSRTASTNGFYGGSGSVGRTQTVPLLAAFRKQYQKSVNQQLSINPWQLFLPRRIPIPEAAAAATVPTLSASTYVTGSLTSTGWRPQITAS